MTETNETAVRKTWSAALSALPLSKQASILLGCLHEQLLAMLRFSYSEFIEIMAGRAEPRREGERDAPSAAPKGFPLNGKLPLSRVAARLLSTM